MATDKPRFTITLDNNMLEQVLEYKSQNRISTQSKAIQKLIELGMAGLSPKPSPASLSPDEMQLLSDYRGLTPPGKEYIRQTMAMAKNSYGEKNDSVSDLEAAD